MNIFLIDKGLTADTIYNFICSYEHPSSRNSMEDLKIGAECCAEALYNTYIRRIEGGQYRWASLRCINDVKNIEEYTKINVSDCLRNENYIGVI